MIATSPAFGMAMRVSHSVACSRARARPSAESSSSDITCGSEKPRRPSMSNTTIFFKPVVRSRTARILSSCSSSSTNRYLASQSLIRYSTCAGELVG